MKLSDMEAGMPAGTSSLMSKCLAFLFFVIAFAVFADMPVFNDNFACFELSDVKDNLFLSVDGKFKIVKGNKGEPEFYFSSDPAGGPTGLAVKGYNAEDDLDIRFAFRPDAGAEDAHLYLFGSYGGGLPLQLGCRKLDGSMKLLIGNDGDLTGSEFLIQGVGNYGQWITIRVLRVFRTIKVKAWKYGEKEPEAWMASARIGAHVAGGNGIMWRFRNFSVAEVSCTTVDAKEKTESFAREQEIEDPILRESDAGIEKLRKEDCMVEIRDQHGKALVGAEVEVELKRHEFLFGCNVMNYVEGLSSDTERNLYKELFSGLFNYGTLGFYWHWFEKKKNEPDYPLFDQIAGWCAERRIQMKGHPLLWDSWMGIPMWMGKDSPQPSPEMQRLHVESVMKHYAGKIAFWELVNEPASLSGIKIEDPYRWAHASDPKAKLIINDYRVLDNGFPAFFKLLEKAEADGIPFDAIGIQAHVPENKRFPLDGVRDTLDKYARLGKDLHITEFTPASNGLPILGSHLKGKWDEGAQADYSQKFYRTCFAHPAVKAISWWGFLDSEWPENGGLLTKDLEPKAAYKVLKELIHQKWHTKETGRTDMNGIFRFRGFHGEYTVKINGLLQEGRFVVPATKQIGYENKKWSLNLK